MSYREVAPPAALRSLVECVWLAEATSGAVTRVLPDGCADLLYTRWRGDSALHWVGPMTGPVYVAHTRPEQLVGMRFRPGTWTAVAGVNAAALTDDRCALAVPELQKELDEQGAEAALFNWIAAQRRMPLTPMQQAISALERSGGKLNLDRLAFDTNLSARQFRRNCLTLTGYTPGFLKRVLRFRRAMAMMARSRRAQAEIASECGYADQSHMIAEFQRFAGATPVIAAKLKTGG